MGLFKTMKASPGSLSVGTIEKAPLTSGSLPDSARHLPAFWSVSTKITLFPLTERLEQAKNDVNRVFTVVLPSDNSNTSHTHLTRFYCRPRTIASYFSLLLKNKNKKTRARNFQVSLLTRNCFDSSCQLLLTSATRNAI